MDLWTYGPLMAGCVCMLVGMSRMRRQPQAATDHRQGWKWMTAAMILCGGSSIYTLIKGALGGETVLLVPAVLVAALSIVVVVHLRPVTASAEPRTATPSLWTGRALLGIIAALGVFFAAWIGANIAANFFPDAPGVEVGVAAGVVGVALLVAVPLVVLDSMTRSRQRFSAQRSPVSAEVADKIYQSGLAAALNGLEISRASFKIMLFGATGAIISALVALLPSLVDADLPDAGPAVSLAAWMTPFAAVLGGVSVLGALGIVTIGPLAWQSVSRLRLANLSEAELSAARQRRVSEAFPGARYPAALAGSLRTVKALTIAPSRLVSLEDVTLGSLEAVDAIPLDEYVEVFQDGTAAKFPSIDDMDDDEGVVLILKLARALVSAYGDGQRFDAFLEEDETVRILLAVDDDYEDFPTSLAHEIAQSF